MVTPGTDTHEALTPPATRRGGTRAARVSTCSLPSPGWQNGTHTTRDGLTSPEQEPQGFYLGKGSMCAVNYGHRDLTAEQVRGKMEAKQRTTKFPTGRKEQASHRTGTWDTEALGYQP